MLDPLPFPERLEPLAEVLVPPGCPLAEPRDAVPPEEPPADPLGVLELPVELLPFAVPAVDDVPGRPLAASAVAPLDVPLGSP